MRIFKLARQYGYCLDKALAYLESHPSCKLVMGEPGREGDTAHFWVEDEGGRVYDGASDAVPASYQYRGRVVDPAQFGVSLSKLAYSNEEAYLRDYLRGGVDVFDYAFQFRDFLEDHRDDGTLAGEWLSRLLVSRGVDDLDALEDWSTDLFEEWESQAGEAEKAEFIDWVDHNADDEGGL